MPTDLKQRIAEMKSSAMSMLNGHVVGCSDCAKNRRNYNKVVTPESVLALIAEIERLERENAELQMRVKELLDEADVKRGYM